MANALACTARQRGLRCCHGCTAGLSRSRSRALNMRESCDCARQDRRSRLHSLGCMEWEDQ
eukprot:5404845-Pleurochrysis_carterae.AAC.9